ncbi:MAG: hypothetical protein H6705_16695 [Myxococcales bacterium]|nr:hypothetical protein [Myxococcales bacterium]
MITLTGPQSEIVAAVLRRRPLFAFEAGVGAGKTEAACAAAAIASLANECVLLVTDRRLVHESAVRVQRWLPGSGRIDYHHGSTVYGSATSVLVRSYQQVESVSARVVLLDEVQSASAAAVALAAGRCRAADGRGCVGVFGRDDPLGRLPAELLGSHPHARIFTAPVGAALLLADRRPRPSASASPSAR